MSTEIQIEDDNEVEQCQAKAPAWSPLKCVNVKNPLTSLSWEVQGRKIHLESSPTRFLQYSTFNSSSGRSTYYYFAFYKNWYTSLKYATVLDQGSGNAIFRLTEDNAPKSIQPGEPITDQRIFHFEDEHLLASWNPSLRLYVDEDIYSVGVTNDIAKASKWKLSELNITNDRICHCDCSMM